MDNLTHGLFGLAVGALRRPDGTPTDKAVLVGCFVASELPDLDYLWPAGDAVMRTLQAHRGPSHSLFFAPLVALIAATIARFFFRRARLAPVFGWSLAAVVFAHLLPDLWTGWGTRVLLPFSDTRLALDWTGVIDPLVTLPLLAGALLAWRRRAHWRRMLLLGLAISTTYVGARVAMQQVLKARVARVHPQAQSVDVFPAVIGVFTWRYVAGYPDAWSAGRVGLFEGEPVEENRPRRTPDGPLPKGLSSLPPVHEALSWARFPVVRHTREPDGRSRVSVADLRYHLRGAPTLSFVVEVNADGAVVEASLDRSGSARDLLQRWRGEGRDGG